ncbi:HPF/RaiA family ribosome-associated protein, partial [Bacillus sp. S34]|nr:HPF/RaiA family ribosome-associated protein [Bacillus sp. S34]
MDVTITGRNIGVTDRFRTYVEQKSEKIDVLADGWLFTTWVVGA